MLPALPLTPNGKVDRAALPAPDPAGARRGAYAAPRTPAEERMAGIWAEVLGLETVGVEDDFFELGGHSLLATQVASRVREAFRTELPLRALFEAPTVAELSRRVEAMLADAAPDAGGPPLVRVSREGPLPLSFAQQRLWFIDRLEPGSAAYNVPLPLRLRGALDVPALERSIREVMRRHEALRTVFAESGGEPVQVVHPARAAPLPLADLAGLPPQAREGEAMRLAADEARRPFDLREGPLLRAGLLRLGPEEHVLLLCMHHIVSDGWSTGVLFRELSTLYPAFSRGAPSPLPEPPVQYADFAVWQRAWLAGETLERQLAWWRERLAGAPATLAVPTDRPRRALPGAGGGTVARTLPRGTAERLRALARGEGATLHMVLLAALDVLLARWSGETDVVVGTPVAGRTRREVEGVVGFFVNTLALRADVSADPSFRELLGRVREGALGAYQHQDVPFERLVESMGVERSLAHAPLFQVMLSVEEGAPAAGLRLGEVEAAPFPAGGEAAQYDLSFSFTEARGAIDAAVTFREALWDRSTIERVLERFAALLEQVAADPGPRISEIDLLGPDERERLVGEWSAAVREHPAAPVHERVAEQAARTPGATAVVAGERTLSYAELDAAASRLARVLRARGVGPETRVGVCLERAAELPVALLAILRAGAAYVPLDPGYPAERLAWTLIDSGAPVLLTRGGLAARFGGWAGELVCLDAERERIAAERAEAPAVAVDPDQLAYVIYTSGSTGRPKGVAVPHRALSNHMAWMQRAFPLAPADRVLQKTPAGFDASVWEFWAPLLAGATLVVAPPEAHRDPAELLRTLERERITVVQVVPSLLHALLERPGVEGACGTLRRLFCGGEALGAELAARARAATGAEVVNLYGPTEVCIDSVAHVYAGGSAPTVPIGRPIDNVRAYVLDAWGAPAGTGVPGELY
ncbi:MAG TPA: amino acid adenylation domain-containing protein, partial [Longimicrobiaceae bacterium]|nr:amino acid adenylation domain-containing protein [Longimicrobiaceae bacterium]